MADDSAFFVESDEFGESVVYTKASDSSTRTMYAIVERDVPQEQQDVPGKSLVRNLVVTVRNDATNGISASELKTRVDTITVAERLGETARVFPIVNILSMDSGMLRLQLR